MPKPSDDRIPSNYIKKPTRPISMKFSMGGLLCGVGGWLFNGDAPPSGGFNLGKTKKAALFSLSLSIYTLDCGGWAPPTPPTTFFRHGGPALTVRAPLKEAGAGFFFSFLLCIFIYFSLSFFFHLFFLLLPPSLSFFFFLFFLLF